MSERPRQLPPPSNPALPPVLAAVTWVAAVVAASGFLSLLLDSDVVSYADAGPLLGPAMVAAGAVATWFGCWRVARASRPLVPVLLTGIGVFVVFVLVGGVGYGLIQGSATWMLLAAAHFSLSPFVVAAAVLAALVAAGTWALTRPRR